MVRMTMTKAFLNTDKKKKMRSAGEQSVKGKIWLSVKYELLRGNRADKKSQVIRIRYRQNRPVIPKAASSFVTGRNLKQLMMTLYVAARVLNRAVSPISKR